MLLGIPSLSKQALMLSCSLKQGCRLLSARLVGPSVNMALDRQI